MEPSAASAKRVPSPPVALPSSLRFSVLKAERRFASGVALTHYPQMGTVAYTVVYEVFTYVNLIVMCYLAKSRLHLFTRVSGRKLIGYFGVNTLK